MAKEFIRVIFIIFYVIFFANDAQLMSHAMPGDNFKTYDGKEVQRVLRTIPPEAFKTHSVKKVEGTMSHSAVVQNYSEGNMFINEESRLGKEANDIDDKDHSGDASVESTISSTVLMEWTMIPLTANKQYFVGGQKTDAGAYSEDGASLKPSESKEILGDLHSDFVTFLEFSGNLQLQKSTHFEQSGDMSQDNSVELSGSEGNRAAGDYFVTDLKVSSNDLGARSIKQGFPSERNKIEETHISTYKFSLSSETHDFLDSSDTFSEKSRNVNVFLPRQILKNFSNVEINGHISAVPRDIETFKKNPSTGSPRFLVSDMMLTTFGGFQRASQSTLNGVWKDDKNKKVAAELRAMSSASATNPRSYYAPKNRVTLPSERMSSTSATSQKRYKTSQVPTTLPSRRISLISSAKPGNYETSEFSNTMAPDFSREIDNGKVLLRLPEVGLNAAADNTLQDLYFKNNDKTSQKIRGYSDVLDGRFATGSSKIPTYFAEYPGRNKHSQEPKSKTDFISTRSPNFKMRTQASVFQDSVEIPLNSTATEPTAKMFYPYQKLLMICSAIFILLLGVAAIVVVALRRYCQAKKCCTRNGTYVDESRCEELAIPLNEIIIHRETEPPEHEHLSIDQEEYDLWVVSSV